MDNNDYSQDAMPVRDRILRNFEMMLDRVLQEEEPPAGIPPEIWQELQREEPDTESDLRCDLYEMWSVLTVLAQESKLQARGFRQLEESVLALAAEDNREPSETIIQHISKLHDEVFKLRQQQNQKQLDLEHEASADFIGLLIDIRERLRRGRESSRESFRQAEQGPKCLLGTWCRNHQGLGDYHSSLKSLLEGYTLNLEHLEEVLEKLELHEIDCLGQSFDPQIMTAVELDCSADVADGTVLEVYRPGYLWREKLFRPACVKVARKSM